LILTYSNANLDPFVPRRYDRISSSVGPQSQTFDPFMYIVLDGIAEVVSEDGCTVFAELGCNSFFGEVALFFDITRTATVRAQDTIVMFELKKEAFRKMLQETKGYQMDFERVAGDYEELFLQKIPSNYQV
jgi:CRP-like cAMP-binding protein